MRVKGGIGRRFSGVPLVGGLLAIALGAALPPSRLLQIVLPAQGAAYRDLLHDGLWCLKAVLLVTGLLTILFPWLKQRLWDVDGETPSPRPFFSYRDSSSSRGTERWIVAGLVGLAFALRLIGSNQSLWGDEIAVQQMFVSRGLPVIFTYFPYTPQHVLYSVLAWFTQKLPLPIEISYRLPAVLFGSAAVGLTYMLTRRVMPRFGAILVAVLAAVSLPGIMFSHIAKSYSANHCMTLLVLMGVIGIGKDWRHSSAWWLFGGGLLALAHFHLYNAFLCAGLVFAMVFMMWRVLPDSASRWAVFRRLVFVLGIVGVALLLLYSLQLPQIAEQMRRASSQPEEKLSVRFLRSWLMQLTFWGRAWPLALGLLALSLVGSVSLFRREKNMGWLLLLPIAWLLFFVVAMRSWIYPRYLVFTLPVFLILCAEGVHALLGRSATRQRLGLVALAVVFVGATTPELVRYYQVGFQNVRAGVALAQSNAEAGDVLASYGLARDLFPFYSEDIVQIDSVESLDRRIEAARPGNLLLMYAWRKSWPNRQDEFEAIHERFATLGKFDGFAMDLDERDGEVVVLISKEVVSGHNAGITLEAEGGRPDA
ncbi:MAG: hypothetical protein QGH42_05445 [Kiritimatiellia bacterium]|jgi:hypothetical protein|nr:hypothetical protein [Kiritimatiellia bacterium]